MQIWLPRPAVRGALRHWLTARGSLSERLRAACSALRPVSEAFLPGVLSP